MTLYIVRNMKTGNESALVYEQLEAIMGELSNGDYKIVDSEWVDCRVD